MTAYVPHIIRKKLANGSTAEYAYAFRGGPRVPFPRDHPDFEAERAKLIETARADEGVRVAKRRIRANLKAAGVKAQEVQELASKLVRNARYRAARRRLPCELTVPAIEELLLNQKMVCAVSGLPFDLTFNLAKAHARNMYAPSLDRLDNRKGYVVGNVRVVLAAINYAINEWGLDEYLKICKAVAAVPRLAPTGDRQ